jgi:hypothetical protein
MGHEAHHHEEKKPLSLFASPLTHHLPAAETVSHTDSDLEHQQKAQHNTLLSDPNSSNPTFGNMDCTLHEVRHPHANCFWLI